MDDLVARLRYLPKGTFTLQGELVTWPASVRERGRPPYRPVVPLWAETPSGFVHASHPIHPDDHGFEVMLRSLVEFVSTDEEEALCPSRIEVRDPELATYLRNQLSSTEIQVEVVATLKAIDDATREMLEFVGNEEPASNLLSTRRMSVERVRAFAQAAKEFYLASPWRYLSDSDLVVIESPKPPKGMSCFVVLGAGRSAFGLGIYPNRKAYEKLMQAGKSGDIGPDAYSGLTHLSFDSEENASPDDIEIWEEHRLPLAGPDAYPSVDRYLSRGQSRSPSPQEMNFLEGLMRTLAKTSEEEIDQGRWQKVIDTHDGPVQYSLSIPDLIDPPSPKEWLRRGFDPDRRASEQVIADAMRYVEAHPGADITSILQKHYVGHSIDEPLTEPRSPAERAQDLCYKAFSCYGRRRVQLAREALRLDPDCADAHVLLAEQSGTAEDELAHYQRGFEAATRTLGEATFSENIGEFWNYFPTRPYMRARFGLAQSLVEVGRFDEAIVHALDLLRLNSDDRLGVRHFLLPILLECHRDADAARLLQSYDEQSAHWQYARALLAFRLGGHCPSANLALERAIKANPFVLEVICAESPIPSPSGSAPDSMEEGYLVAEELLTAIQETDGAMEWMEEALLKFEKQRARQLREERQKDREKEKKKKRRR